MRRDGTGYELLRHHDVSEYLKAAEDDVTTAVLRTPVEGLPGVTGITVLKPFPGKTFCCCNKGLGQLRNIALQANVSYINIFYFVQIWLRSSVSALMSVFWALAGNSNFSACWDIPCFKENLARYLDRHGCPICKYFSSRNLRFSSVV